MAAVETEMLTRKPTCEEKIYVDDVFSLWNISIGDINGFIEQTNRHHPTIKFMAENLTREPFS